MRGMSNASEIICKYAEAARADECTKKNKIRPEK
jgi:hypothetical protein